MSAIGYSNHKILGRMFHVPWHPKLTELLIWLTFGLSTDHGKKLIITSSWRPQKIHDNDSGIHCTSPLRAFDLRSHIQSNGHYESIFGKSPEDIENMVNTCWQYDPDRPRLNVCVFHDTGLGHHYHFQVHPNTLLVKSFSCESFVVGEYFDDEGRSDTG